MYKPLIKTHAMFPIFVPASQIFRLYLLVFKSFVCHFNTSNEVHTAIAVVIAITLCGEIVSVLRSKGPAACRSGS